MITIETTCGSFSPAGAEPCVPGSGDCMCKGPEAGTALCLRKNPETCVAGAERMGRSGGGMRLGSRGGQGRATKSLSGVCRTLNFILRTTGTCWISECVLGGVE